jgi:ABC-type bacteriocin/lantibiotic exporter with double-glycine peptidase domain
MQIDPDKAEAYDVLSVVFGRLLLTIVLTICIVVVLVFLLLHPNWPMAALEMVLAGTCYQMVRFYFPSAARKRTRSKAKKAA